MTDDGENDARGTPCRRRRASPLRRSPGAAAAALLLALPCAAAAFQPEGGAALARRRGSPPRRSGIPSLLAAAERGSGGTPEEGIPPPLFDADLADASRDDLPSLFRVPDLGHFDGVPTAEDVPSGASASASASASAVAAAAAAALASDADAWTTYARDEDDMLTEREDRLYVDEAGRTRKVERCVLVGVEDLGAQRRKAKRERRNGGGRAAAAANDSEEEDRGAYFTLEESMTEMRELIKTAGLELAGEVTQRLNEPNPKTYIGTGKVKETQDLLKELDSCTVVFDAELTPGQQKALENAFNKKVLQNDFLGAEQEAEIKVIDRTALILDIFAQHAKTREGKLQVDLALHEYRKPRLTRMWTHLERQSGAGGVGLRGPGESQLEIDKRLLRDRIIVLRRKIDDVQRQRDLHRDGRSRTGLPVLALVGYTNAGKSTLLNHLTRAGVMAEDILFATLDPTTRRVRLPGLDSHPEVLLTDTVGFIQKLPTHLVAAFRATLEEVREADVLVHVVDASNPAWRKQERSVLSVLDEIGAGDRPVVRVLNKIDLLDRDDADAARAEMAASPAPAVAVSSITGEGMEDFVRATGTALSGLLVPVELILPYSKGDEMNVIHEVGSVEEVEYREEGTYVRGRVPAALANRLAEYSVRPDRGGGSSDRHPMAEKMRKVRGNGEEGDEAEWAAMGRGRHVAKNSS